MVAMAGLAVGGCDRKAAKAMPAATDWQAPAVGNPGVMPGPGPGGAMSGGRVDPHAGVAGAPPLSDEQISGGSMPGANPHAGVPGAPPLGDDLATDDQGAGGGVAVEQLGLVPPDRDRAIDASKFLGGTLIVPVADQAKIPAGATIFVSVRSGDAGGAAAGMPMAVDKLTVTGTWPLAFRITEAQAMVSGTAFAGTVVISAWYDQDGEARAKQPGDISGTVKATIPADGLVITLDTIQP